VRTNLSLAASRLKEEWRAGKDDAAAPVRAGEWTWLELVTLRAGVGRDK